MPQPPTGTVTFLFTDIEASTKRWEQHPRAMQAAFERQEAILRSAVESNGGYLYKMIGDAFQAAFPTAPSALQAAADAQRALHAEKWPADTGDVRVRMALHTGVTEERGDDYVGPVLNRAARLLSAGYGGQVLLSTPTYELVRDLLPDDLSLRDLGEHRLKDLIRPEHVFQLVVTGLPSNFPALKTLDYHPNNLPRQATALIGREKEVEAVCALLRRPDVTLVALIGPGGIGKTRLVLQAGAEVLDEFPDGVWFVELAPLSDPALVVSTIAGVLEVKEGSDRPLVDALKLYLRDKRMLLALDTFEQVTEAAPRVHDLLAGSPAVKIVVTSREPLHLYGEWDYQVPPLSLPDVKRLPPLERLGQYEAVRLFIERAQAAKAEFQVTNDNAPAVAEICVRLDGLPLAIELAAARIRMFPPNAILARLQERFKLLSGGARDRPLRQQTIRNTIAWSYDLLDEAEKQLFRRFSVFQGGSTLEAAGSICDFDGALQMDVIEGVERLVDRSLLRQDEGSSLEPRLSMLETIHDFALEKLADDAPGEAQALQRAHALYFAQVVDTAEPQLRGDKQREWLDLLEEEHDNLRAALAWARNSAAVRGDTLSESGQEQAAYSEATEVALRIGGGLWRFWYARGYLSEGREQLARVLSLPGVRAPVSDGSSALAGGFLTRALNGAGFLEYRLGNYVSAQALFHEALENGRESEDKYSCGLSLNGLGIMAQEQGDYDSARSFYEQSLALRRELGDKHGTAATLSNLGLIAQELEQYKIARPLLEESLALAREIGDKQGISTALLNSGVVAKSQADYPAARANLEESLALARELNNKWGVALSLGNLADIAQKLGDHDKALSLFVESLILEQELGDRRGVAWSLEGIASALASQGKSEFAARLWGAAEALREAIGTPLPPGDLPHYKHEVAAARSHLGPEAFSRAWDEGRAMSMEQAVAFARRVSA